MNKTSDNYPKLTNDIVARTLRNISKINTTLYRSYSSTRYYSLILGTMDRIVTTDIDTAAITLIRMDYTLLVNPFFWDTLTDKNKVFVLAHEINHRILEHVAQAKNYNSIQTFNIAADLYINKVLMDDLTESALPGCYDTKEWNDVHLPHMKQLKADFQQKLITEEVYKAELKKLPMRAVHPDDYEDVIKPNEIKQRGSAYIYNMLVKYDEDCKNPSQGGQAYLKELADNDVPHPAQHKDWKQDQASTKTEEILKKIADNKFKNKVKESSETLSKAQGSIPGHLRDIVEELLRETKTIINWKDQLRQWTGGRSTSYNVKRTRAKPNLIIEDGYRLKFIPKKHIAFFIDTSGSMSKKDIIEASSTICDFLKVASAECTVIEVDSKITKKSVYKLKSAKQMQERLATGMIGGGGTSFDPAVQYLLDNRHLFSAAIYITDGYVSKVDTLPFVPILTILTSNGTDKDSFDWNTPVIKIPHDYFQ